MTSSPLTLFFTRWANFRGRSSRREFWWPFAVYVLLAVVYNGVSPHLDVFGALRTFFHLAIFVPALSLSFRRLHDRGCGGQWLLIGIIPVVGPVILLVLLAGRSRDFPEFPQYPEHPGAGNEVPVRWYLLLVLLAAVVVAVFAAFLLPAGAPVTTGTTP